MDIQKVAKTHYYDPYLKREAAKILPGEYYTTNSGEMIVTTLGSCIAACIRDTVTGVGGMNHFMLPASESGEWAGFSDSTRFGNFAMEKLINEIIKLGGQKRKMEARLFGGGQLFGKDSSNAVGQENARFAREYLRTEGIMLVAADVGGSYSRKVYFDPATGKVMVKKIDINDDQTIAKRESTYATGLKKEEQKVGNDVELFDDSNNLDDILF